MRLRNIGHCLAGILALTTSTAVFAYGIGVSTFPLAPQKKLLSGEFTGLMSKGGGAGIQARYTQNINVGTSVDAGFGLASGERSGRFFAGVDYEIFPDYERQPRIGVKTTLTNAKEFGQTHNMLSVAPTVSKGLSFWGREGYPYFALPYTVSLNSDKKTYETTLNASLGANAPMSFIEGYEKLIGNAELTVGLKDSFTAIFMGVSYPIN